jgi:heat shock protein HspQ
MQKLVEAKFSIGNKVKHKFLNFRGVIFDLDPEFNNSEEWYQSIPEQIRPIKEQPFYHLFAENNEIFYIAYVSEQNLVLDKSKKPCNHPAIKEIFEKFDGKIYIPFKKTKN